jgi:hypothetical protein
MVADNSGEVMSDALPDRGTEPTEEDFNAIKGLLPFLSGDEDAPSPEDLFGWIFGLGTKSDIKKIDYIVDKLGLSREQRRILHDEITGQHYSLKEIEEIAKQIKDNFPNK